jgi:hypothetical protein
VVVTVRTVSTVSTGPVTATVDAGGSKTPDGGTATGACATTAGPAAGVTMVSTVWARATDVPAASATPNPTKMTLFLIENSLHFPRIERTEPAGKTRVENGRS